MSFRLWRHWMEMRRGQRRAGWTAVVTLLVATTAVVARGPAPAPQELSRDGPEAPQDLVTGTEALGLEPTPTPLPGESRSAAVVSVDEERRAGARQSDPRELPALATYVYGVDGWEEGTAIGRRDYPDQMRMKVHRPPRGPTGPLGDDELLFELDFSSQHRERTVMSFADREVALVYEEAKIEFPPVERVTEATYRPSVLQILSPLLPHEQATGWSEARDREGQLVRTEDWSVQVVGQESVEALGRNIETWVVRVERASRSGSEDQLESTRTYWFDPERRMFVRWTEELRGSQPFGPGNFIYQTRYTATLEHLEPLD